jgi:hypothetical protein
MDILHEVQLTSYGYLFRRHFRWSESGLEIRSLINRAGELGEAKAATECAPRHPTAPVGLGQSLLPPTDSTGRSACQMIRGGSGCQQGVWAEWRKTAGGKNWQHGDDAVLQVALRARLLSCLPTILIIRTPRFCRRPT